MFFCCCCCRPEMPWALRMFSIKERWVREENVVVTFDDTVDMLHKNSTLFRPAKSIGRSQTETRVQSNRLVVD